MISWFNAPNEGLSPGGQLTLKTLTATENKTYSEEGTAYTSVTVDVEGGGGGFFSPVKCIINGEYSGLDFNGDVATEYGNLTCALVSYNNEIYSYWTCSEETELVDEIDILFRKAVPEQVMPNIYLGATGNVTVSGDATIVEQDDNYVLIYFTGDFTITIS